MDAASVELTTKQDGARTGATSDGAAAPKKKKKDNFVKRLYRQNLSGYVPIPRPRFAISFFGVMGTVLLGIGVALFVTALNVHEEVYRYDNTGVVQGVGDLGLMTNEEREAAMQATDGEGWVQTPSITVSQDLKAPVYVYYRLGNYYQNYRRYINSANWNQLHGDNVSASSLSGCDPIRYVSRERQPIASGLPNDGLINPCGLWPWSYFNDTYTIRADGETVQVSDNNLAWSWQRNKLFGAYEPTNFNTFPPTRGGSTIEGKVNEDERFMIWMRPEAHYTFQKLWGVINQDIEAGTTLEFEILNRYNMYAFGGEKTIVLSENSWMGGRNLFLGILMMVVGCLYFVCAAVFIVGRLLFNRPLGDERYLSWHRMANKKGFVQGFKDFVKR